MITHDTTPDIVLTAPVGTTVTIYEGAVPVGSGTAVDNNPLTLTLDPLSNGVHSLTAKAGSSISSASSDIGSTALPPIIVDDSEPFDIRDVVVLTPNLSTWNLDGSTSTVDLIKRNLNFLLNGVAAHSVAETPAAGAAQVTVTAGDITGTTKIYANSVSSGFYYLVSTSPLPVPKLGAVTPTGAVNYHPGDNISGVDAVYHRYVGFYETDEQGNVLRFALILLTPDKIKQGDFIINGIVTDDSESGAGNVTLHFREGGGNETGSVIATTVTDSDGLYSVALTPATYTVEAGGFGYKTVFLTRNLVAGYSPDNDLYIERLDAPEASVTVAPGMEAGTTAIHTSSAAAGYYYEISSAPIHTPKLGSIVPTGAMAYQPGHDIYGVDKDVNKYIGFYEVDDQQRTTRFKLIPLTSGEIRESDIRGQVTDTSGSAVQGVTIKFREGTDNRTGAVIREAQSDSDGYYGINLHAGIYTAEVSRSGYVTSFLTRALRTGTDIYNDLVVTPIPQDEEMRIVLTWGMEPRDLDSHFIGPTPDENRFHVFYGNPNYAVSDVVYAQLDADDTTGQGPETTTTATVLQQVYGTYTFYVHNYSQEAELSQSNAKVEVYKGNSVTPAYTYSVPTIGTGRYWEVFDIEIDPLTGTTINDLNRLTVDDPISAYPPVTMLPPITVTSVNSISAMSGNVLRDGEVQVNLANNAVRGLSKDDFQIRASVYNVTTGVTSTPQLSSFSYNPVTRTLKFDPHELTDRSHPEDELEVTLTVGPSSGTVRLDGAPAQQTFYSMPPLVFVPNTQGTDPASYVFLLNRY
jgi:hypothetical protein